MKTIVLFLFLCLNAVNAATMAKNDFSNVTPSVGRAALQLGAGALSEFVYDSDITGLVGGTATDLDSITTVGVAAGRMQSVGGGVLQPLEFYVLTATVGPANPPYSVQPVDYNVSTNAKLWVRTELSAGSFRFNNGTGETLDLTFAGGGEYLISFPPASGVVALLSNITINSAGFDGNLSPAIDTIQELAQAVDDLVAVGGSGDFLADGSVPMTGDLDMDGNDILSIGTMNITTLDTTNFQIASTAVTSTAAELNVLDGIPVGLTATELGYVDGVTSGIQGQITQTLTGTHAAPSTSNPLAPTWTGPMHTVFYGATGEIDLPAAAGYAGRGLMVYNTGAFTVSIDPNASEIIVRDGTVQTGGVTMTLSSGAGNFVALLSDGARWVTLGYKGTLDAGS